MLVTRFCPVCGAANSETEKDCFACGQTLPDADQDSSVVSTGLLRERYRLGTIIGSGGYSAVYRGWDTQEGGRAVAVKQITLHGLNTEETIEATNTYNREIEALSSLSHPQVPRLYDYFNDPDHWYLVLEYIEGETLEQYLEKRIAQKRPLKIEEILSMGLQLCFILRYLHSRQPAFIFRDLKPGNIMHTSAGKLYLIDFGIARRYIPGQRRDTQSLGSPGYAAPEQYGRAQTDERTDLYSLGVLLHQFLTGHDPSNTPHMLPPLRLNGQPGNAELEKLVNRLLSADPLHRPASAQEVARELEHIRQRSVSVAGGQHLWQPPVPQTYSTARGAQVQQQFQYMQQQQATQSKRKRVSRRGVVVGLSAAVVALGLGIPTYAWASNHQAGSVVQISADNTPVYTYKGHSNTVTALAWSPDGKEIASVSTDGSMRVWQALDGSGGSVYQGKDVLNAVAWSPDNFYVAVPQSNGKVGLWGRRGATMIAGSPSYTSSISSLAWDPYPPSAYSSTAAVLAAGASDGSVVFLRPFSRDISSTIRAHAGTVNSVAYSPDGWYLATGGYDGNVKIWDVKTRRPIYTVYQTHSGAITSVTWLPNGVYLASASVDQSVFVWSAVDGTTLFVYRGHTAVVNSVAASPDGHYLASASDDATVQVWSAFDGSLLTTYTGHTAPVTCVSWSPDGTYLASSSADMTVQVWKPALPLVP